MQRCKYPTKTMNITQSYTGTYHMDPVPGACADAQLYGLCDDHGDPSQ